MTSNQTGKKQRLSFLDAACGKYGFCLLRIEKDKLADCTDISARDFVSRLIEAEGIKPVHLDSYEHFKPLLRLYLHHVRD